MNNINKLIDEIKSEFKSPINNLGRPKGSGKTPKLVCMMTGKERATNLGYLNEKASKLGVEVSDIVNLYISKTPLTLLKKKIKETGNKVTQDVIKSVFISNSNNNEPTVENVEKALYMNGKGVKNNDPF